MPSRDGSNLNLIEDYLEAYLIIKEDIEHLKNISISIANSALSAVESMQGPKYTLEENIRLFEEAYEQLKVSYAQLTKLNSSLTEEDPANPEKERLYQQEKTSFQEACADLQNSILTFHQEITEKIDDIEKNHINKYRCLIIDAINTTNFYLHTYEKFEIAQKKLGNPLPYKLLDNNRHAISIINTLSSLLRLGIHPLSIALPYLKQRNDLANKEDELYLERKLDAYQRSLLEIKNRIMHSLRLLYLHSIEQLQDTLRGIRFTFNTYKAHQLDLAEPNRHYRRDDFSSPSFFWSQPKKPAEKPIEKPIEKPVERPVELFEKKNKTLLITNRPRR